MASVSGAFFYTPKKVYTHKNITFANSFLTSMI